MEMTYRVAWKEGDTVFYIDAFDYRYVAKNGSLSWRINNPGLVKHYCRYAKKMGTLLYRAANKYSHSLYRKNWG